MNVFSVKKDANKIIITNTTPKKVLLRLILVTYEVSALTYNQERVPKMLHDEISINRELKENEKVEINSTIDTVKKVSIVYKDLENDVTLREDHEL
jgi:hypothetical protein